MSLSFSHLSLFKAMFLAMFHHVDGVPTFLVSFVIHYWSGSVFLSSDFFSNRTSLNCHRVWNGSPLRTSLFQKLRKAIYLIRIRLSELISFMSVFLTKYIPGGKKSERKNEQKLEGWRMHKSMDFISTGQCVGRGHGSEEWKWWSPPSFLTPNNTRLQNWN